MRKLTIFTRLEESRDVWNIVSYGCWKKIQSLISWKKRYLFILENGCPWKVIFTLESNVRWERERKSESEKKEL